MEKITSKSNNLIKEVKKLFTSRKFRNENQKFVLEGVRLCFDVMESDCVPCTLLITEAAAEKYEKKCNELIAYFPKSFFITDEIAQKICDTQSSQGVFAVCKMRSSEGAIEPGKKYIALDQIQDPSNLGAIVRTAEALGISGALLFNCCDVYNPKALRA